MVLNYTNTVNHVFRIIISIREQLFLDYLMTIFYTGIKILKSVKFIKKKKIDVY